MCNELQNGTFAVMKQSFAKLNLCFDQFFKLIVWKIRLDFLNGE